MASAEQRARAERDFDEALECAGVGRAALSARESEALARRGFVVLADALGPRELDALRAACARVPDDAGAHACLRPELALAWTHSRLLAAVRHVLARPFRVLTVGLRAPAPGQGAQGLHSDWPPRALGQPTETVSALWMLDDFTGEPRANGATRVVPGTHLVPASPPRAFAQPQRRHPDEELVLGRAGSLLVFHGHLWHSGTRNRSSAPRRAVQVQMVASRSAPPPSWPAPVLEALAPLARALLGG